MKPDRYILKTEAKRALAAARPNALVMTLAYLLLTTGVSRLVGALTDGLLNTALRILVQALAWVVSLGYLRWVLNAARGRGGSFRDLTSCFSMTGSVIILYLARLLFCVGWGLAIFLPAALLCAMFAIIPLVGWLLVVGVLLAAAVLYLAWIMRYELADFCLLDEPEAGPMAAIRRSSGLVRAHLWDYFMLMLSFIGWHLLAMGAGLVAWFVGLALSGGLMLLPGMMAAGQELIVRSILATPLAVNLGYLATAVVSLWLEPYVAATRARFYDAVRTTDPLET